MVVKMFDLARDHAAIKDRLLEITGEVFSKGDFILGSEVKRFEEAFAAYIGAGHAVAVGSGTDAIKIGGLAFGLRKGDRIVTTPNTYIATAMSLSLEGIEPVFCDIEAETYNMDANQLKDVLEKEKGIKLCIPVHLYGHPFAVEEIIGLCKGRGIGVMEDACQAHGARYKGKRVGAFGDVSAFSFYPTKNLGCYGDGGMLLTDSEAIYEESLMLRNHGQKGRHVHVMEGYNSRLDEVQAAILSFKLEALDALNEKRRRIAGWYRDGLQGLPLVLPEEKSWAHHVYHLFVVRSERRDELIRFLGEQGVTALIHYPMPIHLQPVYRRLGYREGSFPNAERAAREILSLPMYPSLGKEEVLYTCDAIRRFYGR
jgi:dTDP-4-amino-4,6-dideoxygalactose transaminase